MAETFYYFHPADNVAEDATITVTTGTEDTAYPADQLVDLTPKLLHAPAMIEETSGAWVGDFGAAQRVDYVVLWHNLDAGTACAFQMHASNAWSSPTVSGSFTIPARRADGYSRKVVLDVRALGGYTTAGLRYFRLVVTGTNSVPVAAKILLFNTVRQLSVDFQWGVEQTDQHIQVVMATDAGVRWNVNLASAPRRFRGTLLLTDTDAEAVREWVRAAAGSVHPVVLIPEPTQNDAWFGYLSTGEAVAAPTLTTMAHATVRQYTDVNMTSLVLDEVTAGDPEWI